MVLAKNLLHCNKAFTKIFFVCIIILGRIKLLNDTLSVFIFCCENIFVPFADEIGVFMVNDKKAKMIAQYGLTFAVIMVAMLLDRAISSALPISMALTVLLVTNTFALIDNRWRTAIIAGLFFGLASLLKVFIFPNITSGYNLNPLVSVLPRVIMGVVLFAVYRLMLLLTKKIQSQYARQTISITVAVFFGLITNTILYLFALNTYQVILGESDKTLLTVIKSLVIINILPEYLLSIFAVPHLVLGVRRGLKLGIDGNANKYFVQKQVDNSNKTQSNEQNGCNKMDKQQ